MKRDSKIALLFQKQASKTKKIASTQLVIHDVEIEDGGLDFEPPIQSGIESEIETGDTTPHPPSLQQPK